MVGVKIAYCTVLYPDTSTYLPGSTGTCVPALQSPNRFCKFSKRQSWNTHDITKIEKKRVGVQQQGISRAHAGVQKSSTPVVIYSAVHRHSLN